MKPVGIICYITLSALVILACSRADYTASIVGTWEWTGEECATDGSCKKEIMTDEGSRETFTRDGFHLTPRSRNRYMLNGATVSFDSAQGTCGAENAEILSLSGDMLLLKCGSLIRRYGRVTPR